MKKNQFRVGRIGFLFDQGEPEGIPQTHASAFDSLPQAKLVSGANRGKEQLDAFGRRYSVNALYQEYRQMLQREQLDIVCIATHPGSHEDMVVSAVEAGVRGICGAHAGVTAEVARAWEGVPTILAEHNSYLSGFSQLIEQSPQDELLTLPGHGAKMFHTRVQP